MDFARRTTTPPRLMPFRLARAIWRQGPRTQACPETPRLDGKLAVVTGGNAGIGLEIARGLARRGAEVIIAARTVRTALAACASITKETGAKVHHVPLDLADLASVVATTNQLQQLPKLGAERSVDIVVANAGIWPQAYTTSPQGHELAFATNTLGHHVLIRRMLEQRLLRTARVVVLTGDIYIRASECSSDFRYQGAGGGALAYSRSKLGNIWFARELQRRYPALEVSVVHPGVIASNLGGEVGPFATFIKRAMMLDLVAGAQTPLFCATQPNVLRGGYYHNIMGLIRLSEDDPAASDEKASALWDRLEELAGGYVASALDARAPAGASASGN